MSFVIEMCVKCAIVLGGTHMHQRIGGKDILQSYIQVAHHIYSFFPGFFYLAS